MGYDIYNIITMIFFSIEILLTIFIRLVIPIVAFFALLKYLRENKGKKQDVEIKRSLGEILKAQRTRCQLTQEFVAESLGVSRQAVSKWENGTSDPSTTNLLKLARLYGISPEDLLRTVSSPEN